MSEYSAIRTSALALIKKKGRPVTIILAVNGVAVDPTKPWNVGDPDAPTVFNCRAVCVDLPQTSNEGLAAKTVIVPGDCGATEDQIDETTRVKIGALTYGVTGVTLYSPDGVTIGWKLRCELWRPTSKEQQTSFSAP